MKPARPLPLGRLIFVGGPRSDVEVVELCGGVLDDLASLFFRVAAVRGSVPEREPPLPRLLQGLAHVLRRLSQQAALVVVLDDAHFGDASSWESLRFLARHLDDARLLVVLTGRPTDLADHELAAQVRFELDQDGFLIRLGLAPLARGEMRQLIPRQRRPPRRRGRARARLAHPPRARGRAAGRDRDEREGDRRDAVRGGTHRREPPGQRLREARRRLQASIGTPGRGVGAFLSTVRTGFRIRPEDVNQTPPYRRIPKHQPGQTDARDRDMHDYEALRQRHAADAMRLAPDLIERLDWSAERLAAIDWSDCVRSSATRSSILPGTATACPKLSWGGWTSNRYERSRR